jgi:hypothetical protein
MQTAKCDIRSSLGVRQKWKCFLMNIDGIRRYRTAAFRHQVVNRLGDLAMLAQLSFYAPKLDQTKIVEGVTSKFIQAIAPVIGVDNVSSVPRYDALNIRQGGLSGIYFIESLGESLIASAATDFLLLFDDMGLLSAGAEGGYYAPNSEQDILDVMRREYSVLIPYIDVVDRLLQIDSIRNMFEVVLTPESSGGANFMRTQAGWFDAKTDGFKECVRLLLFEHDSTWQAKYSQLVRVRERLVANPGLQLFPQEVDGIAWGLTGAEPLFRPRGLDLASLSGGQSFDYGLGIGWSMTSKVIYGAADDRQSRTRALQEIRARLRSSAINITLDENAAATRQLMQSLRNQVEPADSEHRWDDRDLPSDPEG